MHHHVTPHHTLAGAVMAAEQLGGIRATDTTPHPYNHEQRVALAHLAHAFGLDLEQLGGLALIPGRPLLALVRDPSTTPLERDRGMVIEVR